MCEEGEIEGVDFGYVALFAVTTIFGAMVFLCVMLIKSGDTLVRSHGYKYFIFRYILSFYCFLRTLSGFILSLWRLGA